MIIPQSGTMYLEDRKIGEATIDLTSDNIAKSIINQILSETSKTY
jgi:hypothetical protein